MYANSFVPDNLLFKLCCEPKDRAFDKQALLRNTHTVENQFFKNQKR